MTHATLTCRRVQLKPGAPVPAACVGHSLVHAAGERSSPTRLHLQHLRCRVWKRGAPRGAMLQRGAPHGRCAQVQCIPALGDARCASTQRQAARCRAGAQLGAHSAGHMNWRQPSWQAPWLAGAHRYSICPGGSTSSAAQRPSPMHCMGTALCSCQPPSSGEEPARRGRPRGEAAHDVQRSWPGGAARQGTKGRRPAAQRAVRSLLGAAAGARRLWPRPLRAHSPL